MRSKLFIAGSSNEHGRIADRARGYVAIWPECELQTKQALQPIFGDAVSLDSLSQTELVIRTTNRYGFTNKPI